MAGKDDFDLPDDRGDSDYPDDDAEDRSEYRSGRVYAHKACGGMTKVSGNDYTRLADPFSPVTQTYCCGCSNFVKLNEVRWADTGESISKFRSRMRAQAPALLKAWNYGLGLLVGAAVGSVIGLLITLAVRTVAPFLISMGVGAVLVWFIGTPIIQSAYNIDYRMEK